MDARLSPELDPKKKENRLSPAVAAIFNIMRNVNAPMRVLMISSEWPTKESPNDVPFLVRQVAFLRQAGVEVDVFHFRGAKNPLRYLRAWREARHELKRNHYDLIHAQFGQSALLAMPKRLPLLITIRGDDVEGIVGRKGQYTFAGYVLRLITRWLAGWADALIVVSPHMRRHFPHLKSHVMPSGIDLNLFRPMSQSDARLKVGLMSSKRLVLFVGNPDDPRKQFGLAQKAVSQLDRTLDAELAVAWNVPHSDIPVFMNACDVLVFTSMHEGSPNVVKEALACNLPVVSVIVGDVADRLNNVDGCVVCADDKPATIASALTQVLQLSERPVTRVAVQELDEQLLTARVIEIYRTISGNAKTGSPVSTDVFGSLESTNLSSS